MKTNWLKARQTKFTAYVTAYILVILAILVVINFVVITKGAGRIAEVGARFMLDAMPGKQMAIDADLNAGLIGEDAARKRPVVYDKAADAHYNFTSAFIKSMRGSDPDAAVYYLAAMLEGGEDARFIARRMVILASEDIGNADPRALLVAVAAAQAVEHVGLPEARLNLSQAAIYLARAPKSARGSCSTRCRASRWRSTPT